MVTEAVRRIALEDSSRTKKSTEMDSGQYLVGARILIRQVKSHRKMPDLLRDQKLRRRLDQAAYVVVEELD